LPSQGDDTRSERVQPVLPRPACRRSLVARSCAGLRAVACCAGLHPVL